MSVPTTAEPLGLYIAPPALTIPGWVKDLNTFRKCTYSDDFPQYGLIAYFKGDIWVDLSPEELLTHNFVKGALVSGISLVLHQTELGSFVTPYMRWTNVDAGLSTEPDGLFHTWETLKSGRLRFVKGAKGGIIELEGTPDMVLEIVSNSSVNKDNVRLRELYWQAEIQEYWLVDARGETPQFTILRRTPSGFAEVPARDGWLASAVLGKEFQLVRQADPLGNPQYKLETR